MLVYQRVGKWLTEKISQLGPCLTVSIFRNGKSSCKHHLFLWAIYTIAMLNNQRVNRSLEIDHEFCSRKKRPDSCEFSLHFDSYSPRHFSGNVAILLPVEIPNGAVDSQDFWVK